MQYKCKTIVEPNNYKIIALGSIATKTLINMILIPKDNRRITFGILISIDTSKESNLYVHFKYISFIKFNPTHQELRKFALFPKKGENTP